MPKSAGRDGVFQRKDTPGWYVSYVDSLGQRKKKRVEAHSEKQARDVLATIKAKVQKEAILGVRHSSDITTEDLLKRFRKHQKTRLRPTTFQRLDSIIATLNAHLPLRLKDISRANVAGYVSTRSEVVSPASVQKEIATLKHALRLAVEWELIHNNPADRVRLPRLPEGRTRYLSPTELKSALEAAPDWMRAPMALAAFTGMRRGEILSLCWKDVDQAGRRLYLQGTKNGSMRVLMLNELAGRVISSLPQGDAGDLVFPDVDGPRLSVYTRRVFLSIGIKDASFHSLRHTAASWLVMQGADLYAVGQVLGHKTPRMTQRYAHLSPQYMANSMGKLDTAFRRVLPASTGRDSHGTNFEPSRNKVSRARHRRKRG